MKKFIKTFAIILFALSLAAFTAACDLFKPVIPEKTAEDPAAGGEEETPPAAAEPLIDAQADYDWFSKTFKGVGKDHVFYSLVYDEVYNLLSNTRTNPGDYALFIGGAWDEYTRGVLPHVNEAAKQNGVKRVYFFDPKLDGGLSEGIVGRIYAAANADNSGRVGYSHNGVDYRYDDLEIGAFKTSASATLLKKLNDAVSGDIKLTAADDAPVPTPTLVIINKAAAVPGESGYPKSAPAATVKPVRAGDAAADKFTYARGLVGNIAANYKAKLGTVFAQMENEGDFDVFTVKNDDSVTAGGTTHLDYNDYFKTVTYAQLIDILESDGEYVILFGGTWCPNTAALYYEYQEIAKAGGYNGKIYLFDARLDGAGGDFNIRNNENGAGNATSASKAGTHARLYANIMDNYFYDYWSVWNSAGTLARPATGAGAAGSDSTFTIGGKVYTRMCIPNIFLYNKAVDGGIIDSFESELTWANVKSKTAADKAESLNKEGANQTDVFDGKENQYNFLTRSTENLFAKAGLSYNFISQGYAVYSYASGLDVTFKAARGEYAFTLTTYYNESAAARAEAELKESGIDAVRNGRVVYYGDEKSLKVKGGVKAFASGEEARTDGGNQTPADNGGGGQPGGQTPVTPPGGGGNGDEEIC